MLCRTRASAHPRIYKADSYSDIDLPKFYIGSSNSPLVEALVSIYICLLLHFVDMANKAGVANMSCVYSAIAVKGPMPTSNSISRF